MFWVSVWSWSVFALFETSALAFEVAVCVAELEPLLTSPPAIDTGTLALTAFWSLFATPRANWSVSAFWTRAGSRPLRRNRRSSRPSRPDSGLPSQPQPLPMFWVSVWS